MERQEWLAWRHSGIGSSDAASVHGKSPYKTKLQLFHEKKEFLAPDNKANFVQQKGIDLEPKLRGWFSSQYFLHQGVDDPFEPALIQMAEYPFMKASLDGITKCRKGFIECKYVGKKIFESGEIPEHYWIQMQHQYLVSNCDFAFMVMGTDANNMKFIPVNRDQAFIEKHLMECERFWQIVMENKAPPASDKDYVPVDEEHETLIAKKYIALKKQLDAVEEELNKYKEKLITKIQGVNKRVEVAGLLRVVQIESKGTVDYKKVPELQGVDLEPYRGPSRTSFRVEIL